MLLSAIWKSGRGGLCVTASEFPAFGRVVRTLQTNAGRKKVLACMQQRLPLTRPTGEKSGASGIPECQAVVDAMSTMKAGNAPGRGNSFDASQESGDGASGIQEGSEAACPPDGKTEDVELGELLMNDGEVEEIVDPVLQKAKDLAQEELAHISVHKEEASFVSDVQARVLKQHKASGVAKLKNITMIFLPEAVRSLSGLNP